MYNVYSLDQVKNYKITSLSSALESILQWGGRE
jgi:hypothetical protein